MFCRIRADVMVTRIASEYAAARRTNPHDVLIWIAPKVDAWTRARLVAKATLLVEADVALAGGGSVMLTPTVRFTANQLMPAHARQEEEQAAGGA